MLNGCYCGCCCFLIFNAVRPSSVHGPMIYRQCLYQPMTSKSNIREMQLFDATTSTFDANHSCGNEYPNNLGHTFLALLQLFSVKVRKSVIFSSILCRIAAQIQFVASDSMSMFTIFNNQRSCFVLFFYSTNFRLKHLICCSFKLFFFWGTLHRETNRFIEMRLLWSCV